MGNEQLLESVLEDLLAEIGGPLKESCIMAYTLIEKCAEDDIYKNLLELFHDKVDFHEKMESAKRAMRKYKNAVEKVAKIGISDDSSDTKLKYVFDQIFGPIRNGANAILSFTDICNLFKDELPDEVQQMVEPASESWGKFRASNEKISEIAGRLPKEKIDEYQHYHIRGKN